MRDANSFHGFNMSVSNVNDLSKKELIHDSPVRRSSRLSGNTPVSSPLVTTRTKKRQLSFTENPADTSKNERLESNIETKISSNQSSTPITGRMTRSKRNSFESLSDEKKNPVILLTPIKENIPVPVVILTPIKENAEQDKKYADSNQTTEIEKLSSKEIVNQLDDKVSKTEETSNESFELNEETSSEKTPIEENNEREQIKYSEEAEVDNADSSPLENQCTTEIESEEIKDTSNESIEPNEVSSNEKKDNLSTINDTETDGELNDRDVDSKINELLSKTITSESENEDEQNGFFDLMAEEGEEDTPSEGSNDIVEVGEEINTTESELSTDESYESNSFIDDEDHAQLLSGEEYDLSLDHPKRKSRIIKLSSGSDDEIVKIDRPKKEKVIKKKKSRIMKFSDSSDEEIISCTDVSNSALPVKDSTDGEVEKESKNVDEEILRSSTPNEEEKMNTSTLINVSVTKQSGTKKTDSHKCIELQNTSDASLSDQVKEVIDTLSSGIKLDNVSINLSLSYNENHKETGEINTIRFTVKNTDAKTKKKNKKRKKSESNNVLIQKYENNISKKKGKKRKRSKTKLSEELPTIETIDEEVPLKKKRKYKPSKQGVTQTTILEEAISNSKVNLIKSDFQLLDDWNIKNISHKELKPNTSKCDKKFSVKDFKNSMIYDSTRVKRIGTKQMLKKKGYASLDW